MGRRIACRGPVWRAVVATALLFICGTLESAATVTFEAGDLAQFTDLKGSGYSVNPTAGVGGGSGLVVTPGNSLIATYPIATTFPLGEVRSIALDYQQGGSASQTDLLAGFSANPTAFTDLFHLAAGAYLLSEKLPSASFHDVETWTSDSNGTVGGGFLSFVPTPGEWYRMEFKFERINIFAPADGIKFTFSRWDIGPAGVTAPVLLNQQSTFRNLGDLMSQGPFYAVFQAFGENPAYDNFTVVLPEPTTSLGLILLGGVLTIRCRPRLRH